MKVTRLICHLEILKDSHTSQYKNNQVQLNLNPFKEMLSNIFHFSIAVKESSMILLQTVPTHIQIRELEEKLMGKVYFYRVINVM